MFTEMIKIPNTGGDTYYINRQEIKFFRKARGTMQVNITLKSGENLSFMVADEVEFNSVINQLEHGKK